MAENELFTLDDIRGSEEILDAKPQLRDLYNLVSPVYAIYWRKIGNSLQIPSHLLDNIEHDHHNIAENCCNAMWEEWLDMDSTAMWRKVMQAIDSPTIRHYVTINQILADTCGAMNVEMHNAICHVSDQMQSFYINQRYKVSDNDWLEYQLEHFTSVALIHHKENHTTVREVIAVANKMHRGSVKINNKGGVRSTQNFEQSMDVVSDEYLDGCQAAKDISEIFTPLQTHSVTSNIILIEGAPGIGKTILSKEIAFQWANKNILHEKVLLFLIYLRDPITQEINCLKEFVAYAMCSSLQNKNVDLIVEYLESTSGNSITIVLDGYDETSSDLRQESFISKMISRRVLRLCELVITSRPTASAILHANVDCRVEILGFTKEDRKKYLHHSLKGNLHDIKQLESYLEKNPFINSLCYIPLNMTILVNIFKENTNYKLPKNQTEINEQFICIAISRFLRKRDNSQENIKSLASLPAPYKQQFKNLSKIAFELLSKDQVVFNVNDMKEYPNCSDLGLLRVVKYSNYLYRKDTPVLSYNFLHFTMQEFLAAYYVTTLTTRKQIGLLKDNFWDSRYHNCWVMYVGLTNGDSFALKHFLTGRKFVFHSLLVKAKDIASETISDKVKCLHLFQCFLEAGNDGMCQQVGNYLADGTIDLSNTTLLSKDIHTLCFFLTRSTTKQWKLLDLSNCNIEDDGCDILGKDDKANVCINKMNLSINHLTSRSIPTITKLVQNFNVEELIVSGNHFNSQMFLETFFTCIIQEHIFYKILLSVKTSIKLSIYAINCRDLLSLQLYNYFQSASKVYSLCFWNTSFKADELVLLLSNVNPHSKTMYMKMIMTFKFPLYTQKFKKP